MIVLWVIREGPSLVEEGVRSDTPPAEDQLASQPEPRAAARPLITRPRPPDRQRAAVVAWVTAGETRGRPRGARTRRTGPCERIPFGEDSQGGGAGGRTGTPPPAGLCQTTTPHPPSTNQQRKKFLERPPTRASRGPDRPPERRQPATIVPVMLGWMSHTNSYSPAGSVTVSACCDSPCSSCVRLGSGGVLHVDVVVDPVVPIVDHDADRLVGGHLDLVRVERHVLGADDHVGVRRHRLAGQSAAVVVPATARRPPRRRPAGTSPFERARMRPTVPRPLQRRPIGRRHVAAAVG